MDLKALEFTELRILSEENKGVAPGPEASLLKVRGSEIQQNYRINNECCRILWYF